MQNRHYVIQGILCPCVLHFPTSDFTDIQRNCKKDIAYTYQVPSILLDVEGSTYSNFEEGQDRILRE